MTGRTLLTRDGGPIRTSPRLRDKVALFADGTCLVSRGHGEDPEVVSLLALARRLGFKVAPRSLVDLGTLRSLYTSDEGTGQRRADTAMQRELYGLLERAAACQASDIHLVVDRERTAVRVRVDGMLQPMAGEGEAAWRAEHGRQLCLTAYAMAAENGTADANYDPYNYQAGRILSGLPEGLQAVRLQFNPVGYTGRQLVMRLLYAAHTAGETLAALGFDPGQVALLEEFLQARDGMVIIAGPTGSGKTTTLERMLRHLVAGHPGDHILSVEDPPEYLIPGVIQLPVANLRSEEARGQAFTEAIAAALRSDPDRIMIGEIRTQAAAHHAFEAAMTGHQVMTTLHANDAMGILPRLRDIGVETYKLRDPALIRGLVAQRLVRRRSGGGRTVVAEVVRPDQALLDLLCAGERGRAEAYWRDRLGGGRFLDHALAKIAARTIDRTEAERHFGRLGPP